MSSLPPPPPPPSSAQPPAAASPGALTCYRHPSRPAYRRCTRCDRPTCDDCLTPGSIGSLCPECVQVARPPTVVRARQWSATRGTLLVTYSLIVVNLVVAVYVASSETIARGVSQGEYNLALNRFFVDSGEWWRIVTSGFLHFGFAHLAMNMFSLFVLGRVLEPVMAKWAFFALYMTSLLAGSAGVLVMESGVQITGGASGAIFGLLGATAIALHQRGIGLMQSGIGMALILNLVITFSIPGISIGGHLGGLIGGAVCGYVMLAPRSRYPRWAVWATPLVVSAVAVAVCFAVSAGTIPS